MTPAAGILMHSDLMQSILEYLRYSEMLVALVNKAMLAQVRKGKDITEAGRRIPPQRKSSFLCSESVTRYALGLGPLMPHRDLLVFAGRKACLAGMKVLRGLDPPCRWDGWTCACAAEEGHLPVL